MEESKEKITKKMFLAAFIITGFVLFIVAIFVIGSKQNLFTPTFKLSAFFQTVSGLKEGSSVRFNGIIVGTVNKIIITGPQNVKIEMTIDNTVKKFIKKDSKATVISEGLVGNKIVEITSGSPLIESVDDGDNIETFRPIDTEDILKSLKESGEHASLITKELADVVSKVNQGQGTIGQLVNNDALYKKMDNTMQGFSQSSEELNKAIRNISSNVDLISNDITQLTPRIRDITRDIAEISRKMNSSESIIGTLLTDTVFANNLKDVIVNANRTTANLERGSNSFSQNMEALKHNFLFKGYFEDIGYWDKSDFDRNLDDKKLQLRLKEQELNSREKELNERESKLNQENK
ncbi:MAG: MlaD family protein [Ignavibacteria bacterium]